jgi:uncharacterized membrane protein
MPSWLTQFELEHPWRLCWLALLLPGIYFAVRTRVTGRRWRRAATMACRVLIVTSLVLALAGLIRRRRCEQRFVVFATDVSRSIDDPGRQAADEFIQAALEHKGTNEAAFLVFADQPGRLVPTIQNAADGLDVAASNPAEALRLAWGSIPSGFVPLVVLLTDGNETAGDLGRAAMGAGVPVSVVPLTSFTTPEVYISDVHANQRPSPGGDVSLEVFVQSNHEDAGTLEIQRGPQQLQSIDVALRRGENRLSVQVPMAGGAEAIFTARLTASQDAHPENNARRTQILAHRAPRALLVDAQTAAARQFQQVLTRQGVDVSLQSPQQFQADLQSLDTFDLLILSDIASADLAGDAIEAVDRYVHDRGGGLILLGGEQTFGASVFQDTPLERLAPVTAVVEVEAEKSVLAIVLVVDKSKSMEDERRMELAKVAAKQSVQVLKATDKVGLIAFSDDVQWIAEIAPCSDKGELMQKIDTLQPRGMTRMYPAVERAVLALEQTDADRRHMILLTDGIPWPGDYREIARGMAESGITLTTVSISPGAEQELLREMASVAGGRHHHCDDAAAVPAILVQETQAVASEEDQQEFSAFALRSLPGLDISSAPKLLGFAKTDVKPDAEPLLFAVAGHPLLSWRRHGAGITVAFTADVKDRWAARWQDWPGYGPFWKRLVRHAARRLAAEPLDLRLAKTGQTITVRVDTPADASGKRLTNARLSATVSPSDGDALTLALDQIAPGLYQTEFAADRSDQYVVRVSCETTSPQRWEGERTLLVDYPDELRLRRTNEALLRNVAAVTGGVYDSDPDSVFAPDGRSVERITTFWRYFVLAALLLLIVDLGLRRLRF